MPQPLQKLVFLLRSGPQPPDQDLRQSIASALLALGASRLSMAVNDQHVAPAAGLRRVNAFEQADMVVFACLPQNSPWQPLLDSLQNTASVLAAYRLQEWERLKNPRDHEAGERVPGMLQLALFDIPAGMDEAEWQRTWHEQHTPVAIELQSTFAYRQNLVTETLLTGSPPLRAIVEESFPAGAMSSQHDFYDSGGDEAELKRRQMAMWQSSKRFIDLEKIEVLPMSEYRWD